MMVNGDDAEPLRRVVPASLFLTNDTLPYAKKQRFVNGPGVLFEEIGAAYANA
jgi:hypothetical protein